MEVRIVKKEFPFGSCWIAYVDNKPRPAFNSFQEAVKLLTECRANCKDKDEAEAIDTCLSMLYRARRIDIKELEESAKQLQYSN